MIAFLTDAQISPTVAREIGQKRADIKVLSAVSWQEGAFRTANDRTLLIEARKSGLVFVTYDQKSIGPLLQDMASNGEHHSGIVFADQHSIRTSDIGGLIRSLIALYDLYWDEDWTDRVQFLSPVAA